MLRSYAVGTGTLLETLKDCLVGERLADYAIAVHGINGSSYGICAREVGSLAEVLDKAATDGTLRRSRPDTTPLKNGRLIKAIDSALTRIEAATDKPTAKAPGPELLRTLKNWVTRDYIPVFGVGGSESQKCWGLYFPPTSCTSFRRILPARRTRLRSPAR